MVIHTAMRSHLQGSPNRTKWITFYTPVSRWAILCIMWLGMAGGHPHRFPHNNFSSVHWIFTKLDHLIALWKGKNPIYFGVIMSKVKVTVTINRIAYRLIFYIDGHILWCTHFLFTLVSMKSPYSHQKAKFC